MGWRGRTGCAFWKIELEVKWGLEVGCGGFVVVKVVVKGGDERTEILFFVCMKSYLVDDNRMEELLSIGLRVGNAD